MNGLFFLLLIVIFAIVFLVGFLSMIFWNDIQAFLHPNEWIRGYWIQRNNHLKRRLKKVEDSRVSENKEPFLLDANLALQDGRLNAYFWAEGNSMPLDFRNLKAIQISTNSRLLQEFKEHSILEWFKEKQGVFELLIYIVLGLAIGFILGQFVRFPIGQAAKAAEPAVKATVSAIVPVFLGKRKGVR